MKIENQFIIRPLPSIAAKKAAGPPLGFLNDLPGTWIGTGFNVIWRPNSTAGQDRFLELNLTSETLEFSQSIGDIPNRGLLQGDIVMNGLTYLQKISDSNLNAGLHIEPGIWAIVPATSNPAEPPTVVRMASIPHGTTLVAQGVARQIAGAPNIKNNDITPFDVGNPGQLHRFPESDLNIPTNFRSPPAQLAGVTQMMVDNPNSILQSVLKTQNLTSTIALDVSSVPASPVIGGGTANTAFLQGDPAAGPNAVAASVSSIFWIERVDGQGGGAGFLQLQYTQLVLLNFNGLSWPHVSVATLRKMDN